MGWREITELDHVPVTWEPYIEVPVRADEAALAALEGEVGVSLPDNVRQVILGHAGQVTEPSAIQIGEVRKTPFSPILYAGGHKEHKRYTYSIEFVLSTLVGWAEADDAADLKLFPFAMDTGNGYFCVSYRSSQDAPNIVFVDLDYDFSEDGAIRPVADDLDGLLSKLQ